MPTLPRTLAVLLACAALAGAGCGESDDEGGGGATATPTPEDTGGEQGPVCTTAQQPAPKKTRLPKPRLRLDSSKTYVATVATNCGSFQITLAARRAPRTAGSFKYLADHGFYDDTTFHRIEPGFVIQGGDPKGNGTGGPGYKVVEAPPRTLRYTRGVVAMAKTELDPRGTSGSQFFVVTGEQTGLPPEYALVGEVTAGENVVARIESVPRDAQAVPTQPVVIQKVTVKVS
jgi:cyclophilin family peptidyl-prolyl cis-trans isomerase